MEAAASAAAILASSASLPPCETDESGAPVTSLGTAWSAVSDERHAPTTSLRLTWSNEEPMVVDDDVARYNGNSAARRGKDSGRRNDDGDEDAIASRACPQGNMVAAEGDRPEVGMSQLRAEILKMSFPRLEDEAEQEFAMRHGRTPAEENRLNKNRLRTVHVVCEQGGTPDKRGLTGPANAPVKETTKNTITKKTSLCLHHNVDSEDGSVDHEPPRRMDNEMTPEMVQHKEEMIRLLHFQQNDTKAIHRAVERDGLILGPRGKQQIRAMRARFGQEQSKSLGGANDAQELLLRLQLEGCWMRFTLGDKGCINHVAWALEAQRTMALRYYPLIVQDNTFNTKKYKHHPALIVVVDKESYTHIAMQALLANDGSEDFEFLFRVFRELTG
eukprot:jgi/Undpi1/8224/HiC_scaffold_25.g10694.m1